MLRPISVTFVANQITFVNLCEECHICKCSHMSNLIFLLCWIPMVEFQMLDVCITTVNTMSTKPLFRSKNTYSIALDIFFVSHAFICGFSHFGGNLCGGQHGTDEQSHSETSVSRRLSTSSTHCSSRETPVPPFLRGATHTTLRGRMQCTSVLFCFFFHFVFFVSCNRSHLFLSQARIY